MEEKIVSKNKNGFKKIIIFTIIAIISIIIITGIIVFNSNNIPSKYYGTYVKYSYLNGKRYKDIYIISTNSIEYSSIEYSSKYKNGKTNSRIPKIEYKLEGEDLIITKNDNDQYLIIDDDCLYIESNKDISKSKEMDYFYWNEKSKKANIYEIKNNSKEIAEKIEDAVNGFYRNVIYSTVNKSMDNSSFYIINSDEKSDETDLNEYKVKFKASGGELELIYNKKNRKIKEIYFCGNIADGLDMEKMKVNDIYDCRAMLLACMYTLKSEDKYGFVYNYDKNDFHKIITIDENADTKIITDVSKEYEELFKNPKTGNIDENEKTYSYNNEKYSISCTDWIKPSIYGEMGFISFRIRLNN